MTAAELRQRREEMARYVAYSGSRGAFAEQACRTFLPQYVPVPVSQFADVVASVLSREVQLGMLPLENSVVGPVPGVADLIKQGQLNLRSQHKMAIRLHLMAQPGVTIEEVEAVHSHPVALGQCTEHLDRLSLRGVAALNTASAALRLAGSGDRTSAVVASEAAASLYGLDILLRDIHDDPDNHTVFGVVEHCIGLTKRDYQT
jgi:prephenate dehydratase